MKKMKIGIGIGEIAGNPATIDDLVGQVRQAERDGFASAWFANIFGVDAIMACALAGRETSRIELGTGVVPTFPRHPTAMAQRQHVDVRSEPQARGPRRDLREHEERIEQRRLRADRRDAVDRVGVAAADLRRKHQVLRHPHRFQAHLLGDLGDRHELFVAQQEERDADLHVSSAGRGRRAGRGCARPRPSHRRRRGRSRRGSR